jgi:hypothetical protein
MGDPYKLSAVQLRHDRAREHLADIRLAIEAFREKNPYPIPAYEDTDAMPQSWWDLAAAHPAIIGPSGHQVTRDVRLSPELSIRVGEFIYNLRSALDHLVFALAWHDSGKKPTGSHERKLQFPIEDREKSFDARRNTLLKGVSDSNVALIERYQPYKRCDWMGVLRDLSNTDKHRELLSLTGALNTYGGEWFESLDAIPEAAREYARLASPGQMDVGLYATLDVTFVDGMPVSETLEQLEAEVGKLLMRFRREFTLPPVG